LPRYTDIRIEQLCASAKGAKTEKYTRHVLKELQATLQEHVGLARESLKAQAATLNSLEAKTKDFEAEIKKKTRKPPGV